MGEAMQCKVYHYIVNALSHISENTGLCNTYTLSNPCVLYVSFGMIQTLYYTHALQQASRVVQHNARSYCEPTSTHL